MTSEKRNKSINWVNTLLVRDRISSDGPCESKPIKSAYELYNADFVPNLAHYKQLLETVIPLFTTALVAQGVHSPRLYTGISIRENGKKPKLIKLFGLLPKSIIIFNGENPEISQNCQKTKWFTEIPICTTIYTFASHKSPAKLRLNIHQLSSDKYVSKYLLIPHTWKSQRINEISRKK